MWLLHLFTFHPFALLASTILGLPVCAPLQPSCCRPWTLMLLTPTALACYVFPSAQAFDAVLVSQHRCTDGAVIIFCVDSEQVVLMPNQHFELLRWGFNLMRCGPETVVLQFAGCGCGVVSEAVGWPVQHRVAVTL